MIVSLDKRFVFFHNPKAGGAAASKTLARFNDIGFGLYGLDRTGTRWLSHLSVDEFTAGYPELWARCSGFKLVGLYRPAYERFVSAVFQYSKSHTDTEIRFLPASQRRRFLLGVVEALDRLGCAEAVMDRVEYTFFRPQWVFLQSAAGDVRVEAWPLDGIAGFRSAMEAHVGEPLVWERLNERDQMTLPAPLARLMGTGRATRLLRRLPGAPAAKQWLKRRFHDDPVGQPFGLSAAEESDLRAFVSRFYARDAALLPRMQQAA